MNTLEKKLLEKLDRNLPVLVFFLVTVMGSLIRLSLRRIVSGDASYFLLPWYDAISMNGLYTQVGDYNLVYQFLIWIMTKLPIPALYSYKALSCLGDFLLAVSAALVTHQISQEEKIWKGIWTYTAVWLCPVVFVNSAAWAQCDSLYSAFAILGLYFLGNEKYTYSLISLGISFAFKLHAVFILPVYLFCYYQRRKFSVLRFALVPVTMVAISTPLLFWGRNLLDIFRIYFMQTQTWSGMAHNYPSFWNMLCQSQDVTQYTNMKTAAILLTVCVLAALMVIWIWKKRDTTGKDLLLLAFLLSYTCVLFLPAMHERYGYLYEILAIIIAVLIPKTIPLCISLLLISLNTYGSFLFGISRNLQLLSFANISVYLIYVYGILGKDCHDCGLGDRLERFFK